MLQSKGQVRRYVLSQPNTIVPLKLDFAAQKKGGMAVSAVWRLVYLLAPCPARTKEHANAHRHYLRLVEPTDRRDALCPSPKIQKQAAFGKSDFSIADFS